MKVLITNGDVAGAWYKGRTNKAYDISGYNDKYFQTTVCGSGTVAKKDGELLYTESEFNAIKDQLDRAIAGLAQHAQAIVELQDEKLRLQQEVDCARDEQKVELPQEVADAIEWFRAQQLSNEEIYELSLDPSDGKYADTLHTWSDTGGGDGNILMIALVNGYMIEQTLDARLREKLKEAYNVWSASPSNGPDDFNKDQDDLFDLITEAVKQIYQTENMT